jgi:hypothetical protein
MNYKIISILFVALIMATVFAAAPTPTLSITGGVRYTNSDFNFSLNAGPPSFDSNEMCFSTTNNAQACSSYITYNSNSLSASSAGITFSSDGNKTIYGFIRDGNTDGRTYGTGSTWIIFDSTAPTITAIPVDRNAYDAGNVNIDINVTDTLSGVSELSIIVKVDGEARAEPLSQITDGNRMQISLASLGEGDHNYTVDANDMVGNKASLSRVFYVDTNAPTSGSVSFSGWTNSDKPTLNVTKTHSGNTDVYARFSCTNASGDTNWSSWANFATTYSDFNINSPANGCTRSDWNKAVYMQLKDAAGNVDNNTYRGTVLYDNVAPSAPTGLSASAGNGRVTLSWSEPSNDDRSGNSRIEIYKNGVSVGDTNFGNTTYTVTGLTNGTEYDFKVKTKDKAGNYSDYSSEVSATPQSTTITLTITKNGSAVSYAKNGDEIDVECEFSDNATNSHLYYAYYDPTTTNDTLDESSSSTNSLSGTLTISEGTIKHGRVGFWCDASGSATTNKEYVYIDNNAPSLDWVDTNNTFAGVKRISVKASDNAILNSVDLNFNNVIVSIKSNKDSNNNYYLDLNTIAYENGSYLLKAIALDAAGNSREITRNISIENIQTTKQKAAKMIKDAQAKQTAANDIVNFFKKEGLVINASLTEKKNQGDSLLAQAQNTLNTNADDSLTKATQAGALFDEFNRNTKVSSIATQNYSFDANNLASNLTRLGLSDAQSRIAEEYIKSMGITRKLTILQTGTEDKRQVKIEISFTNDTNNNTVTIIEVIPKELLNSASKIVSDTNFRILQDDPVIEFTVPVQKGAKATISYGIGEISKEQADSLASLNIIEKFASPPLIITDMRLSAQFQSNGFFAGIIQIAIIIVALLIVAVLIAIFVFFKFKKPGKPMGQEKSVIEHLTPEKKEEKPKWSAP